MSRTLIIQNQPKNGQGPTKWYREFYVWLLILFPVLSIFMGITTIALSISSYDGLVVDDYYKQGLAINEVLKRDQKANELGLNATLDWTEQPEQLLVDLSVDKNFEFPAMLNVKFMHATRGGLDKNIQMTRNTDGLYQAKAPMLEAGEWHVEISYGDWRLLQTHREEL